MPPAYPEIRHTPGQKLSLNHPTSLSVGLGWMAFAYFFYNMLKICSIVQWTKILNYFLHNLQLIYFVLFEMIIVCSHQFFYKNLYRFYKMYFWIFTASTTPFHLYLYFAVLCSWSLWDFDKFWFYPFCPGRPLGLFFLFVPEPPIRCNSFLATMFVFSSCLTVIDLISHPYVINGRRKLENR